MPIHFYYYDDGRALDGARDDQLSVGGCESALGIDPAGYSHFNDLERLSASSPRADLQSKPPQ
jgi:hypothetical protein